MLRKHWVVLGVFVLASTAFAQTQGAEAAKDALASASAGVSPSTSAGAPKSFDVLGGFSLNKSQGALRIGIGAPGLETTFLYGVTSSFTIGGLLALNWGEGADFAIRLQIPIRYTFYDNSKLGVTFGFTPGIAILFGGGGQGGGGGTAVTIPLYLDLSTGYRVTSDLTLLAGFEVPLEIWTKGKMMLFIPLVPAVGLEYQVASNLKLWSRLRSGYGFAAGGEGGGGISSAQGGALGIFTGAATSAHVGVAFAF